MEESDEFGLAFIDPRGLESFSEDSPESSESAEAVSDKAPEKRSCRRIKSKRARQECRRRMMQERCRYPRSRRCRNKLRERGLLR